MPHLDLDDGFRLYYERHGEGPPVVFAHGAGGNAMSWWRQAPVFAGRHTVVAFDHRAFGRSADVEDGPGRTAFGADALALLDALDLGPVHFVAHSDGCAHGDRADAARPRPLPLTDHLRLERGLRRRPAARAQGGAGHPGRDRRHAAAARAARGLPGARAGAVAPLPPDQVDQPAAPRATSWRLRRSCATSGVRRRRG